MPVQLPKSLVLTTEPGQLDYEAGADVPETSVCILNGTDQKVTKGHLGGEKQVYNLCQRLWYCATGTARQRHYAEGECSAKSGCKYPPSAPLVSMKARCLLGAGMSVREATHGMHVSSCLVCMLPDREIACRCQRTATSRCPARCAGATPAV